MVDRPALLLFRWLGRRMDLRVYIVDDQPLFVADDICRALDAHVEIQHDDFFDVDHRYYPAPTQLVDGIEDKDGEPVQFFTVDVVRALADERPMYIAGDRDEFSDWFEQLLEREFAPGRLEQLVHAALPEEPGRKEGESFSVAKAARILSRDPALDYGQQSLFATMQDALSWITREDNVWVPSDGALRAGLLIRQNRHIPGRRELYAQIRITPEGMRTLHQRLGGIATLTLEDRPHLTLVEV